MPEITVLGWFHTFVGGLSIFVGIYTLYRYRRITSTSNSGGLYLVGTVITALTALGIYQHGGFGVAHALAVLTLLAVAGGWVGEKTVILGKAGRYVSAVSYLATLLFHLIPAVTDATLRLPPDDPLLTTIEDPRLQTTYLVLLIAFVIGAALQVRWLSRNPATA